MPVHSFENCECSTYPCTMCDVTTEKVENDTCPLYIKKTDGCVGGYRAGSQRCKAYRCRSCHAWTSRK